MASNLNNLSRLNRVLKPLALLLILIIVILCIVSLAYVQHNTVKRCVIVILVFSIILSFGIAFDLIANRKSKQNYEVSGGASAAEKKSGKENAGYDAEEAKIAADAKTKELDSPDGPSPLTPEDKKWVENYVPYGDYPKGQPAGADDIQFVKETSDVKNGPVEKRDANGTTEEDEKWKKNYVPFEEDSNKTE
jgi:hypothetical protein